jgi:hypothetical protein
LIEQFVSFADGKPSPIEFHLLVRLLPDLSAQKSVSMGLLNSLPRAIANRETAGDDRSLFL